MINDFRLYMKSSPLGISYSGSGQGEVVDSELKMALQKLEVKIGAIIGNSTVKGIIVSSDGKILTTIDDIKKSVSIVEGFNKKAQANVENLDATLEDTEIPTAGKQMLSNDEAGSQFQSVTPTDSQQIGKPQIDVPFGQEQMCPTCNLPLIYDKDTGGFVCRDCGIKGFKVPAFDNSQERFIAISGLLKRLS